MRRSNTRTATLILFLCALAACSTTSKVTKEVFGNKERLDSFLASQQVTAQRLHYRGNLQDRWRLRGYDQDAPVLVPQATAVEVQQLLRQPSSYSWGSINACIPDYGVLLTFHTPRRDIQIALCFQCNMLGIFDEDQPEWVNSKQDFDPIRTQLVAVAKAIFPSDPTIQALK